MINEKNEKKEIGKNENMEIESESIEKETKIKETEKSEIDEYVKTEIEKIEKSDIKDFDLDSSISEISERTPDVSEHVFEANKENFSTVENPSNDYVDSNNTQFDSSIHRSDENGKPILTAKGTFWKKAGRKKGVSSQKSSIGTPELKTPEQEKAELIASQNQGVALISANSLNILRSKMGVVLPDTDEAKEMHKAEMDFLKDSIATWLDDTGLVLNPNVGLALAVGTFFLPAIMLPPEQNKILQFGLKIIGKNKKKKELDENEKSI